MSDIYDAFWPSCKLILVCTQIAGGYFMFFQAATDITIWRFVWLKWSYSFKQVSWPLFVCSATLLKGFQILEFFVVVLVQPIHKYCKANVFWFIGLWGFFFQREAGVKVKNEYQPPNFLCKKKNSCQMFDIKSLQTIYWTITKSKIQVNRLKVFGMRTFILVFMWLEKYSCFRFHAMQVYCFM